MKFRRTSLIHFVGIGGVGMSGIAEVLLTLGYEVSGSDIKENARIRNLRRRGAEIKIGHSSKNISGADVVVKTSAVGEDNCEIKAARKNNIPVIPRAEMLAELMRLKQGIAVAGTHGKTTTTAMVSMILQSAGFDPTVVVGGRMHNLGIGARLGSDKQIVVEADESDGSFLKLMPIMSIVTNIDDDHMDHYGSMDAVEDAFAEFINSIPFYGFAALCGDDERVFNLLDRVRKPFKTYGFAGHNDLRPVDLKQVDGGSKFTVQFNNKNLGDIKLPVPGRFNVLNALGAAAIGLEKNIEFEAIKRGLENFEGVARRFEFKGKVNSFRVYDDYAHHPTEIDKTISAARENLAGELLVVFQPHRYSRTKQLAADFGQALADADRLCVMDVYPAGEEKIEGIDLEFLQNKIGPSRNGDVTAFAGEREEVLNWIEQQVEPGKKQNLFTMGAGDVVNLAEPVLDRVARIVRGEKDGN
ncbi:MAG: UDP-N-acetylmuramate--L-alanine ligase [bacterium]